jgi:PBP1b-binding outer membrane lipoprotein LpoB
MANPLPDEVQGMTQAKQRRQIPGGFSKIRVDDADVKKMAEFAVASLNQRENSKLKLVKITEAASQVVAGSNYKLKLELLQLDGKKRTCEAVIFDQPWTNTRILNQINCVV